MKKFLLNMALMCLLVAVALGAFATLNKQYLDKDNYLYEFSVKQRLIRDTPSPKIVFLGGSNVAFGLDSKTISDSLKLPVINAGLHAGLGLRFIMDNNAPLLRKGDILVIMPEYDHFTSNADGEMQTCGMIPYIASPSEILHLNYKQGINVAKGLTKITTLSIVDGCKNLLSHKTTVGTYQYKMSGFNELGDEESHWSLASGMDMHGFVPAKINKTLNIAFLNEFSEDIHRLEKRGIKVILLPPAIYEGSFNSNATIIASISNALKERKIQFRADTKTFTYPVDMMYNTDYHLNRLGVKANTQNIIKALRNL